MNDRRRPDAVEDALSGRPVTDPRVAEVAAVLADLRRLRQAPAPEVASRHLAAMQAAAAAVGAQPAPIGRASRRHRLHRVSRRWAVSSGLAGILTLTGGLAAAGALPAPAQRAASSVAHAVGLHVPDGESHPAVTEVPATSSTSSEPSTIEDGQDDQGSNRSHGTNTGPATTPTSHHEIRHHGGTAPGDDNTETTAPEAPEVENEPAGEPSGKGVHQGGGSTPESSTTTVTASGSGGTAGGGGGSSGGGGGGGK